MSVPTWLGQVTPNSNGDNVSQNPVGAPSNAFPRPPSASFDPSQLQYQQIQQRMQNGTMRHAPPSSPSSMYETQNIVPSKRGRPGEGIIGALPPTYPGGPAAQRLPTPQETYQGFQGAVHVGPRFRGSAPYQHLQQQNNNPTQAPMMHQHFNSQGLNSAVHRTSPSPFSPAVQALGARNTISQPDHISRANTAQRDGQINPPYGAGQARVHLTNDTTYNTANRMPIPQFTNPQELNSQQQRMYLEARARQMQPAQLPVQVRGVDVPQHQSDALNNPMGHSINMTKNNKPIHVRRQVQARPNYLDRLLRSMVQYMHSRRLLFNPRPLIAAKPVNCVSIFLLGMKLGGSRKIQRLGQWSRIAQLLSVPTPKIMAAGQEIQVYWDKNLVHWERHFLQLQRSNLFHQRHQRQSHDKFQPRFRRQQRRRPIRENMRSTIGLQNFNTSVAQGSSLSKRRVPEGSRPSQPLARLHTPPNMKNSPQRVSRQMPYNGSLLKQKFHRPGMRSNVERLPGFAKQQELRNFRTPRSIVLQRTRSNDPVLEGLAKHAIIRIKSKNPFIMIKSKDAYLRMIGEGAFRQKQAKFTSLRTNQKDNSFSRVQSKGTISKMIAGGASQKKADQSSQKRVAKYSPPKTKVPAEDVVLRMIAKDLFPKRKTKNALRKMMGNDTSPRLLVQKVSPKTGAMVTLPKMELVSPDPIKSYYTPLTHTQDPSITKPKGSGDLRRKLPSKKVPPVSKTGNEVSEGQLRTEYHGGLPISNIWFKDTLDVLVKYKHTTPQINELGVIDIQALVLSMKSGIHGEVRLALDVIAALSHAKPPPLRECEELLDTLIDFARDQIEILAGAASKASEVAQLPSYQEQVRDFKTQSYALQEVPEIGSRDYDLERAANRLVSVTTILRNLSLRPDNRDSLREPSIIRMITTMIRYSSTRHLFLRTHQNALDFSKDVVTFLGALSPYTNLTTKEEGLAIIQFLLSFAPEPRPKLQGGNISFNFYVPTMHRYLPQAVNALAKLIARGPNRALYRSIFASESASSPPFDLLTRAFGLAVSIVPETAHHQGRGNSIIAVRSPVIAQGLLSAEILVGMLPTSAHDIARAWLGSQDGFAYRLMGLLSFISTTPMMQSRRRPDGRLRTAHNSHLGYQMINARGLALLRNLAEKARHATAFASDFSPDVFRLKQSINRALHSIKGR